MWETVTTGEVFGEDTEEEEEEEGEGEAYNERGEGGGRVWIVDVLTSWDTLVSGSEIGCFEETTPRSQGTG